MASTSIVARDGARATPRRLKILSLHGFRTSRDVFDGQARAARWREDYDDVARFHAIDAPHEASGAASAEVRAVFGEDARAREWWNATTDDDGKMTYRGLRASLDAIEDACERDGPYDGVLGFSQGATLAAIALATPRLAKRFAFGILVSGMRARAEETKTCDYGAIEVPTLHVIGLRDVVVPNALSEGLCDAMTSSPRTRETHDGGHRVPRMNVDGAPILRDFLAARFIERARAES
jgi:predicted esterase